MMIVSVTEVSVLEYPEVILLTLRYLLEQDEVCTGDHLCTGLGIVQIGTRLKGTIRQERRFWWKCWEMIMMI